MNDRGYLIYCGFLLSESFFSRAYIYAEKSDVVSDLDLSQGFDLDFYTDHCPNIDESCLGEMGME